MKLSKFGFHNLSCFDLDLCVQFLQIFQRNVLDFDSADQVQVLVAEEDEVHNLLHCLVLKKVFFVVKCDRGSFKGHVVDVIEVHVHDRVDDVVLIGESLESDHVMSD